MRLGRRIETRGSGYCGIAGIAGELEQTLAVGAIGRMISTLARRGPDGDGIEVWNSAVLGHRRLAVFDLSEAGRQPMLSPDGSIGIVTVADYLEFGFVTEERTIYKSALRVPAACILEWSEQGTRITQYWQELHPYMASIFRALKSPSLTIDGTPDHLHILFSLSRVSNIVDLLKRLRRNRLSGLRRRDRSLETFTGKKAMPPFRLDNRRSRF